MRVRGVAAVYPHFQREGLACSLFVLQRDPGRAHPLTRERVLVRIPECDCRHYKSRPARDDLQRLDFHAGLRVPPHPQLVALGKCRQGFHRAATRLGPSAVVPGHQGRLSVDVGVIGEASGCPAYLEPCTYRRAFLTPARPVEDVLCDICPQRVVRRICDTVCDDYVSHCLADGRRDAAIGAVHGDEAVPIRLSLRCSDLERQPAHRDPPKLDVYTVPQQLGPAVA